jgi:hypothetical protein
MTDLFSNREGKRVLRGTSWMLHTIQVKSNRVQLMMLYTQIGTVVLRSTILTRAEYRVVGCVVNITPNIATGILF